MLQGCYGRIWGGRGLTVMVGGIVVKGNGGSGATPAGKGVHMLRER